MKKSKELAPFLNQHVQIHVRSTSVTPDEEGESMMSNIYEGIIVDIKDHFVFMGVLFEDSDKFEITAAIDMDDIAAITIASEMDELLNLLQEMPKEGDGVH
jgi:hypothetical protein